MKSVKRLFVMKHTHLEQSGSTPDVGMRKNSVKTMSKTETCTIDGCINQAFNHGFCEECLNDMQHCALDLAGVP